MAATTAENGRVFTNRKERRYIFFPQKLKIKKSKIYIIGRMKMTKKKYTAPTIALSTIRYADVIRTSNGTVSDDIGVDGSKQTDWWNIKNDKV